MYANICFGNSISSEYKAGTSSYAYDGTNMLVNGTNWKGDKSEYVYNALSMRVERNHTFHSGQTDNRDYVVDFTSAIRSDLMVCADGWFDQHIVYAAQAQNGTGRIYSGDPIPQRVEQVPDTAPNQSGNGGLERLLYVHEDIMGSVRYMTKENGNSFSEVRYDAWGDPTVAEMTNNNDNGVFVGARFTNHTFDFILDVYHAQFRFYDANNRTFMAEDPIQDGLNWYAYVGDNPATNWDPLGLLSYGALNSILNRMISGTISDEIASMTIISSTGFGIYLGFHQIAQVYAARQIHLLQLGSLSVRPTLEYPIPGSSLRADIVYGNQVWEVKPTSQPGAAWRDLQKYLQANAGLIPGMPIRYQDDIPVVPGIKMRIIQAGVGQVYYSLYKCGDGTPITLPAVKSDVRSLQDDKGKIIEFPKVTVHVPEEDIAAAAQLTGAAAVLAIFAKLGELWLDRATAFVMPVFIFPKDWDIKGENKSSL